MTNVLLCSSSDNDRQKKKKSNGKIRIRNLMYDAGNLKQVLCDNLEEWDRKGSGREFQEGGYICMTMADSC